MAINTIVKYGKVFFLDSIKDYNGFRNRLTLLKKVHPKMKYAYKIAGNGSNTRFMLYVRRWGV